MADSKSKKKPRWPLRSTEMGNTVDLTGGFDVGEENLYNKGFVLRIEHVPTKRTVEFSAFITDQTDAFTSNWTEETVFGRMDPIATFESTKRVSTIGFSVPSFSRTQAAHNLARINTLLSMLYPTYAVQGGDNVVGTTLNMGPLVRVKYANIIDNADVPGKGLLGYITTGITVTPNMEAGVFATTGGAQSTATGIEGNEILYKAYELNFELSVLHEHSLGFVKGLTHGGKEGWVFRSRKGAFPYQNKKHLPYTIHGMDFSDSQGSTASTSAAAPAVPALVAPPAALVAPGPLPAGKQTPGLVGFNVGAPNTAERRKAIDRLNKSGTNVAKIQKLLGSSTGYNLNSAAGRDYALQGLSQAQFTAIQGKVGNTP
jgi:hypothetical protein